MRSDSHEKPAKTRSEEQSQEALALLKILDLGEEEIVAGETYSLEEVIAYLRKNRQAGNRSLLP